MDKKLPTNAKVVVIGGGVAGCSVAAAVAKVISPYQHGETIAPLVDAILNELDAN